jgi:hypothetical protein
MMTKHFLRFLLVGLALLLALAPATGVSAQGKPIRTSAPFVAITITDTCAFNVFWEPLQDNGYMTIFEDKSGTRIMVTGVLKSRFTNLDTGKSVDRITSAQFTEWLYPDGSFKVKIQGPLIGWTGLPGNPPLAYVKGQQMVKYDADGNLVEYSQSGLVEDLCLTLTD